MATEKHKWLRRLLAQVEWQILARLRDEQLEIQVSICMINGLTSQMYTL